MTFKELAKQLTAAVQTVPNLVNVLRDGFDQMEGGSSSGHDYSEDEQIVGKWIDGSELYAKTIVIPNTEIIDNTTEVNHNITNCKMVFVDSATAYDTATGISFTFPLVNNDGTNLGIRADTSKILFKGSANLVANENRTLYVNLIYTKNT